MSESERTSESSQRKQQQSAAAFLEKPVKEEVGDQSMLALIDQAELVDDDAEIIDEDHDSDFAPSEKLDPEEYRQLLSEIRSSDIPLSPELQRLVLKSTVHVVRDALAALLERRQKGTVKNPAGYLTRAIQGLWTPTTVVADQELRKSAMPVEVRPPSVEQLAMLDDCITSGSIMDYFLSSDGICKVVMPGGFVMKPWWEFLGMQV